VSFNQNELWGRIWAAPVEAPSAAVIPVQLRSSSHWGSGENHGMWTQINDSAQGAGKKFICSEPRADLLS